MNSMLRCLLLLACLVASSEAFGGGGVKAPKKVAKAAKKPAAKKVVAKKVVKKAAVKKAAPKPKPVKKAVVKKGGAAPSQEWPTTRARIVAGTRSLHVRARISQNTIF